MEFAQVLKANPYHDEKGRFSTEDKAKVVSGNYSAWHGSAAVDKLLAEGYIVGKKGAGLGRDLLGPGMYITPSKDYASKFGELTKLKTNKVKLARVSKEDLYAITQGKEFQAELRARTSAFFDSPAGKDAFSAPDFKGELIADHFRKKGYDGVFTKIGPIPALDGAYRTAIVLYNPGKVIKSISRHSEDSTSKEELVDTMYCVHPSILPKVDKVPRPKAKKSAFSY